MRDRASRMPRERRRNALEMAAIARRAAARSTRACRSFVARSPLVTAMLRSDPQFRFPSFLAGFAKLLAVILMQAGTASGCKRVPP